MWFTNDQFQNLASSRKLDQTAPRGTYSVRGFLIKSVGGRTTLLRMLSAQIWCDTRVFDAKSLKITIMHCPEQKQLTQAFVNHSDNCVWPLERVWYIFRFCVVHLRCTIPHILQWRYWEQITRWFTSDHFQNIVPQGILTKLLLGRYSMWEVPDQFCGRKDNLVGLFYCWFQCKSSLTHLLVHVV